MGFPLRDVPPSAFIGWSGEFLQEMCARAGISWDEVYRDNVVQFQPPRNDFSMFYTYASKKGSSVGFPTEELKKWHTDLKERIRTISPKVIIAAGDHPLYALTGHKSSTQWRGSVVPYEDGDFSCFIVPIVHPSYARRCYNMTSAKQKDLRQPWFYISVFDLKKAKRVSEGAWTPIERTEEIFPTFDRTMEYLEELYAMPSDTLIITDVETIRREHIKCVGLTHRKDYAMCIPFVRNGSGTAYFNINQEAEVWKMIDKVYNTHRMGNQTIDFDHAQFWRDVGMDFIENIYLDTAVLHATLHPELNHDLGFLASLYTDMPYFKYLGRQSAAKYDISQMFTYNCYDCQSTMEIAEELIKEAKAEGMWDYYLTKRLPLLKWAVRQHIHGLTVDNERRPMIGQRVWEQDIKPKQQALNEALLESGYPMQNTKPNKTLQEKFEILGVETELTVDTVNVRSPKQVVELLQALGYKATSSDEDTLKGLEESQNSVVAKTIRELRSDYSLLGSIAKPEDEDGAFRTTIKLYVTETTRLSSTKSHFGTGANLQNVTRRARPLFCGAVE
jgi:uracil-DNA glycosylase family 4